MAVKAGPAPDPATAMGMGFPGPWFRWSEDTWIVPLDEEGLRRPMKVVTGFRWVAFSAEEGIEGRIDRFAAEAKTAHVPAAVADTIPMERRCEVRYDSDQATTLTILGPEPIRMAARLLNCSGRGFCLESSREFKPGTAVRIDIGAGLFLGEITYCRPESEKFRIGIEIEQMLGDTIELARLMRAILGDPAPKSPQSVRTP